MPRPRPNPDPRAAAVALRTLTGRSDRSGRWLLVDERTGDVAPQLTERGATVETWFRWAGPWASGQAGPPEGPFDAAVLRLPRTREALAYALERIAAVMKPGGALWLTGCNDEGVKAAGKLLAPWYEKAETLDTKHHARLWWAERTDAPARAQTADYLLPAPLRLPGGDVLLQRAPGVFAQGQLDPGSARLLSVLPGMDLEVRHALDVGAGIGVLSAGVHQRWPDAPITAVDHDALAVQALQAGLPDVQAHVSDGFDRVPEDARFDLVVSNPPLHGTSNHMDTSMLEMLVKGAAKRLTRRGQLVFVVQRQRPVERLLQAHLRGHTLLADDGRFRVWQAGGRL